MITVKKTGILRQLDKQKTFKENLSLFLSAIMLIRLKIVFQNTYK